MAAIRAQRNFCFVVSSIIAPANLYPDLVLKVSSVVPSILKVSSVGPSKRASLIRGVFVLASN